MKLIVEKARPRPTAGAWTNEGKQATTKWNVEEARPRTAAGVKANEGKQAVGDRKCADFTAFVDRVSKRIPKSALWRIFEAYGTVVDIFIAYRNVKRRLDDTTFAFVRFKHEKDLEKAIREGNGRMMDGFKIIVSQAKFNRKPSPSRLDAKPSPDRKIRREGCFALRDERSFKGVVLGQKQVLSSPKVGEEVAEEPNDQGEAANPKVDKIMNEFRLDEELDIPEKELEWVDNCMLGFMADYYEVNSIQQGMNLEGIPATVCPWSERAVIVKFKSKESMDKLLLEKWSFFKELFSKFELLGPLVCRRESKVWISLANVPIISWHPQFFEKVANRWGRFIQLHDETRNRLNFERARLLIGVENVDSIPELFTATLQGIAWKISVKVIGKEGEVEFSNVESCKSGEESSDDSFSDGGEKFAGKGLSNPILEVNDLASFMNMEFPGLLEIQEKTARNDVETDGSLSVNGEEDIMQCCIVNRDFVSKNNEDRILDWEALEGVGLNNESPGVVFERQQVFSFAAG